MRPFDTFVMVDWSAARDRGPAPKPDAIWATVARAGRVEEPVYLRNRRVAERWLAEFIEAELAAGRRVLAGFDFPFGFPAGFAERLTGRADPLALWDWFAAELEDDGSVNNRFALAGRINARFPGTGPFWFNGARGDIPFLPRRGSERHGHGMAERRAAEARAPGSFSVWQMGGAGAVGGQAMTGMAALSRLRARLGQAVAVWPFEPPEAPVVLTEIWPSLLAEAVQAATRPGDIRDAVQVRIMAAALARLQEEGELAALFAAVPDQARAEEGWILGVGAEEALREAARAVAGAGLVPPRLKDDCFAMPQGVAWVPVDEALARLRAALHPVTGRERLASSRAAGRVLAADAIARRANPPRPNSAVDGYGFAHAATGPGVNRLPLVQGRAAAGQPFEGRVPEGYAVRILTGAILPEGVDTVVLEEDCATDGLTVAFDGPVKPGANTRRAGEDVEEGAVALPAGQRLRPPDIALLSALGIAEVEVFRPLRVAVLSTGDEIVPDPALPAAPHQIWDANRPMLLALVERWGHVPVDLGHARDDARTIARALDRGAREADVILTSGGASAGDEDHVSRLLRERGRLTSWRIALKPGRPLALAMWQGAPVFGLPGNPVAAFVCALIFARPALSLMSGAGWLEAQGYTVPAAFSKRKKPGRREYLRARLTPEGAAEVFRSEGSGRISGLSWATGLVELPDGALDVEPGTPVRYLPYSGFGL